MELKELGKPAGLVAGLATLAVGTFAIGYLVARDRETLRRVVRVAAHTVERMSVALAETREEIADLWAEAREDARQAIEDEVFAAPSTTDEAGASAQEAAPPAPRAKQQAEPDR